jgi:hypothetical protein
MTDHALTSWERATSLLPAKIASQIVQDADRRSYFIDSVMRYHAMADVDLLGATEVCLRNLGRLDRDEGPDVDLRHILIPEAWDRLMPGTGARDRLRRISTGIAEYDPDRPSVFKRLLKPGQIARLGAMADRTRREIAQTSDVDTVSLVERIRFSIAGSCASQRFPATACVYEPGFAYRVSPVVARRLLARDASVVLVPR